MIEQFVKANCLSCLLNGDREMELIPEPFRMQGIVSFRVTYQEYIQYITALNSSSRVMLSASVKALKEFASFRSPRLYEYFLKDLAFAIYKEVWFAEICRKDASIILPSTLNNSPSRVSDLIGFYQSNSESEHQLISRIARTQFEYIVPENQHNINLYKLSVMLYFLSDKRTESNSVSLTYDVI